MYAPKYFSHELSSTTNFTSPKVDMIFVSDSGDEFIFTVTHSKMRQSKASYNLMLSLGKIVLVRLDVDGAVHTNPDGKNMGRTHMHIYNERYGDAVAYEIPEGVFSNLYDKDKTLKDFMKHFNMKLHEKSTL